MQMAMSGEIERQFAFFKAIAAFKVRAVQWAEENGYALTLGDAFRDSRCPYGSKSSKHKRRLAQDINLLSRKSGQWVLLEETEDHAALGKIWEEEFGGIWGGHFDDGNHYEWPD
jgi:hypothetical protein